MKKAAKQKITLAVILILTAGLAWVYLSGVGGNIQIAESMGVGNAPNMATANSHASVMLIDRRLEDLVRATFTSGEHSFTIEAEDEGGHITWNYSANREIKLDQTNARTMMLDFVGLTATDTLLESVTNPDDYGIGRLVVTGYFRDTGEKTISLGMMTPDHSRFYAMIEGDPSLYLIDAQLASSLLWDISDLADRHIPFINTMQLTHIYVGQRDRVPLEFIFDGTQSEFEEAQGQFGGTWLTMKSPFPGRSLNFANFQLRALERFEGFVPGKLVAILEQKEDAEFSEGSENLALFGLDEPLLEFKMADGEGNSFHLILGDRYSEDYIYMMHSGQNMVFLAEHRFIDGLLNLNPFNFIDRFVKLINIEEVERIVIRSQSRGNFDIAINHHEIGSNEANGTVGTSADGFRQTQIAPTINNQEVPDQDFRGLYQALISLSYDQYIGLQEGLGQPDITIAYHLLDGSSEEIDVFAYDPNFYGIRLYPEPVQFVISRLALDMVFENLHTLKEGYYERN